MPQPRFIRDIKIFPILGLKRPFFPRGWVSGAPECSTLQGDLRGPGPGTARVTGLLRRLGRRPWSPLPPRGRSVPSHTRHLCPGCSLCLECPLHLSFQGPPLSKGHPNTAFSPQAMGDEDFIHKEKGKKASLCLLQLPAVWSSLGGCRGRHLG